MQVNFLLPGSSLIFGIESFVRPLTADQRFPFLAVWTYNIEGIFLGVPPTPAGDIAPGPQTDGAKGYIA